MSAGRKHPLTVARDLAARLIETLGPACQRIEVAGSVRRCAPMVGDIELVAIPRMVQTGLFGNEEESVLNPLLANLVAEGRLSPIKNGDRYKQYIIGRDERSITLDLWLVTGPTWGVQLAIRTGNADYSRALVTERAKGGLLRDGLIVREGRVWNRDQVTTGMIDAKDYSGPFFMSNGATPYETPEESDFLTLAGGWVDPTLRDQVNAKAVP